VKLFRWGAGDGLEVMPGVYGKLMSSDRVTVCRFRYEPNVVEAVHHHESEQFCYVIRGRVVFVSSGSEVAAGPGDALHISSNVPHGLNILDEGAEIIEIFCPTRPDLVAAIKQDEPQGSPK
jgi:quercetin dioxygenase-like cupin family protein